MLRKLMLPPPPPLFTVTPLVLSIATAASLSCCHGYCCAFFVTVDLVLDPAYPVHCTCNRNVRVLRDFVWWFSLVC